MAQLTLLPEDDEPHLTRHNVDSLRAPSEAENLLRRFNPRLVGFGIVGPWHDFLYTATGVTQSHHQQTISDEDSKESK